MLIPPLRQICLVVIVLVAMVENCGLVQFFASTYDGYLDEIMTGLNAIGANSTLDILRRAVDLFPEGKPADEDERNKQIGAFTSEEREFIKSLESEFYESDEDLCTLVMDYWDAINSNIT